MPAKVTKRARDNEGKEIGKMNTNPLLDTREYDCVLEDGYIYGYHANLIAKNVFAQCDDEDERHVVLHKITNHVRDKTAIEVASRSILTRNRICIPKTTTKGWKLLCQWRDGLSSWMALK